MGDMGGRVFEMYENGEQSAIGGDQKIAGSVEKIKEFRAAISKWEKEIEEAKAERDAGTHKTAPQAATEAQAAPDAPENPEG